MRLSIGILFGLGLMLGGQVQGAEPEGQYAAAWLEPVSITMPPPSRSLLVDSTRQVGSVVAQAGLEKFRTYQAGSRTVIEVPMDEVRWQQVQADLCQAGSGIQCETNTCQLIQVKGEVRAAKDGEAPIIQSRLLRRAPQVQLPSEEALAQSCHTPVPTLADAGSAPGNFSLELDLRQRDNRGRAKKTAATRDLANETSVGAGPKPDQPFAYSLPTQFASTQAVQLVESQLPSDTSDWNMALAAGCSEVQVPLDSVQPAKVPGVVLALVTAGAADAVALQYGITKVLEVGLQSSNESLVLFASSDNAAKLLLTIAADSRVRSAQPEFVYRTSATAISGEQPPYRDPLASLSYGPEKTGALDLHAVTTGASQVIAVIDTGIDVNHPDLQGRVIEQIDTTGKGFLAEAHGTAVAGVIAASAGNGKGAYGVAPNAQIMAIKACHPVQVGNLAAKCWSSTLVQALDTAIARGVKIINMSLTGPEDKLVARFVAQAHEQGALVVAAAGNGGVYAKPAFPAALPNVLAITATDVNDHLYPQANQGTYVDLSAPGVDIVTAAPGNRYPSVSGTSFAAAHASGVVALLRELNPNLSNLQISQRLKSHANDLGAGGADELFGEGMLNACAAASVDGASDLCSATPVGDLP